MEMKLQPAVYGNRKLLFFTCLLSSETGSFVGIVPVVYPDVPVCTLQSPECPHMNVRNGWGLGLPENPGSTGEEEIERPHPLPPPLRSMGS